MPSTSRRREKERRAAVRHLPHPPTSGCAVESPEKEERWPARIRDISATGFGLLIARPFAVGTLLEVEIERRDAAGRTLTMRVVRIGPAGAGKWLLGCVLEQRLEKGELKALL